MQPKSIPSRRLLVVTALVAAGAAPALGMRPDNQRATLDLRAAADPAFNEPAGEVLGGLDGWVESPAHARLFAPDAHRSQYRAFVTSAPLSAALARITAAERAKTGGAWAIEDLGPLDAFGPDGHYAPYALAKLYTAGPAHVARGPHASAGGFDTWTLVSPYPDESLSRLSSGTLLLVMRVPPL